MQNKTKVKTMIDFLRKVTFNNCLGDILLDFKEDGVHVSAQSANILFSQGLLKKSAFSEYEAIGQVGIPNCAKLVNLLKKKKGDIALTKNEDGKLCYSLETSAAHIPLCEDVKFIGSHVEEAPEFIPKMDDGFNLTTMEFKRILDDWNTLGADKAELRHTGTSFEIMVADDTGYDTTESFPCKYEVGKSVFGLSLKDVMKVVDGTINISFRYKEDNEDNLPMRVREEREHYNIDLIIAPLDPESEAHKKAQAEAKERQDKQVEEEKVDAAAKIEKVSDEAVAVGAQTHAPAEEPCAIDKALGE